MIAAAAVLSLLVGFTVGLLGGGGSILLLPVLVYVVRLPTAQAMTLSLLVVGATSMVALIPHARAGFVQWKVGAIFGTAGMLGALGGSLLNPLIRPDVLMIAFAILMLITALTMLRGGPAHSDNVLPMSVVRVLFWGSIVGAISGLLGAGGGFLVVPSLVLFGGVTMRSAIATSLLVIAMQSSVGFVTHLQQTSLNLPLALTISSFAVVGSFLGALLSGRIAQAKLKRGFAFLVLILAVFVLIKQLFANA